MEAYLEKHPGKDLMRWSPQYNNDPKEWSYIQDRFGKLFISSSTPKVIGDTFEFGPALVPWNDSSKREQSINVFATIIGQVSMSDVIALYGQKLHHKPYCYEVICD